MTTYAHRVFGIWGKKSRHSKIKRPASNAVSAPPFPAGANTDGVCGLSPCLVVQLIPSLDSLTIYLNCMTAAVELVGIGPGTLVQLEGMSVNQSGRRNRYISAGADSSITILSWGEAKHVCKTR